MRITLILCILMIVLLLSPMDFCAGKVKYYQIDSKILADGGEKSQRELGVYLPEEYDTSGSSYPVLYLIHGFGGTNRTFLEEWLNVNLIADRLIRDAKITPLVIALPDMSRGWFNRADGNIAPFDDYLIREIIPFIDMTLNTIPFREARAIAGHSIGGYDSVYIALAHPNIFSLSGGYAAHFDRGVLPEVLLKSHNQKLYPIEFWIYVGKNDPNELSHNRKFSDILWELSIPHVYIEDEGDHTSTIAQRLEESIEFFSKFLNGSVVAVNSFDKTATVWGKIKQ